MNDGISDLCAQRAVKTLVSGLFGLSTDGTGVPTTTGDPNATSTGIRRRVKSNIAASSGKVLVNAASDKSKRQGAAARTLLGCRRRCAGRMGEAGVWVRLLGTAIGRLLAGDYWVLPASPFQSKHSIMLAASALPTAQKV